MEARGIWLPDFHGTGSRLSEGMTKPCAHQAPEEGAATPQQAQPDSLWSICKPPVEARLDSGLPWLRALSSAALGPRRQAQVLLKELRRHRHQPHHSLASAKANHRGPSDSSVAEESACGRDLAQFLPGLGRCPGEGTEATHSSILYWRAPRTVHGVPKSQRGLSNCHERQGRNTDPHGSRKLD